MKNNSDRSGAGLSWWLLIGRKVSTSLSSVMLVAAALFSLCHAGPLDRHDTVVLSAQNPLQRTVRNRHFLSNGELRLCG